MKKIIIGLHGPIGSGKDTLARGLKALLVERVQIVKFAEILYSMAACFDPEIRPDMPHQAKEGFLLNKEELGTRRNFMEKLGTEFGRNLIHPDVWLKATEDAITRSPAEIIVISDVRFPNEADWLRKVGQLVHLIPHWTTVGADSTHPSNLPLEVSPCDCAIVLRKGEIDPGVGTLACIADELRARDQVAATSKPIA